MACFTFASEVRIKMKPLFLNPTNKFVLNIDEEPERFQEVLRSRADRIRDRLRSCWMSYLRVRRTSKLWFQSQSHKSSSRSSI
jgi:hypothetical protein